MKKFKSKLKFGKQVSDKSAKPNKTKKSWEEIAQNQEDDDDDEGGGGAGKRKGHSYQLEGLLSEIDKGVLKAKDFGKFLIKEQLDSHELEKTELDKQVDEQVEKAVSEEQSKEKDKSKQKDHSERDKEQSSQLGSEWDKSPTASESDNARMGFLESQNSDAIRRTLLGEGPAGAVTSGHTNAQGFTKQVDISGSGAMFSAGADMARHAAFGDKVQGANYGKHHADPHGTVKQSNYFTNPNHTAERTSRASGKLFNPLQNKEQNTSDKTQISSKARRMTNQGPSSHSR